MEMLMLFRAESSAKITNPVSHLKSSITITKRQNVPVSSSDMDKPNAWPRDAFFQVRGDVALAPVLNDPESTTAETDKKISFTKLSCCSAS